MEATILIEAIEAAEFTAQSYSGRGMYGSRCVGFTTGGAGFSAGAAVASALVTLGHAGLLDDLAQLHCSRDQMGYDMICYFPGVKWPEGLADPSGEDEEDWDEEDWDEENDEAAGREMCAPPPYQGAEVIT